MEIYDILQEFNKTNSTNDKLAVLKKNKDNQLLIEVFQKALDKVKYVYGVTVNSISNNTYNNNKDLPWALKELEKLSNRELTGNAAINHLNFVLSELSKENAYIIERIIDRDLKVGIGRTNLNKVVKNACTKKIYMRCETLRGDKVQNGKLKKGTIRNIDFSNKAYIQLKADGRYTETAVINSEVHQETRSGEPVHLQVFHDIFKKAKDGYYHGEMTVKLDEDLLQKITPKLEKLDKKNSTNLLEEIKENFKNAQSEGIEYILPRNLGNGLLNSLDVPEHNIIYDLWDYITPEDYKLAALKDKKNTPKVIYEDRFNTLIDIVNNLNNPQVRVIEYKEVGNIEEALEFVQEKMKQGFEGGVLKNKKMLFKDGTSKEQLKCKLKISAEFRIIGFKEGKKGTKRENTFGSLLFANDEGTIVGACSGIPDDLIDEINDNRDEWLGKVIEVEFNDITKARDKNIYALSHPVFIADRSNEKNTTNTLKECLEMKEMAKQLQ